MVEIFMSPAMLAPIAVNFKRILTNFHSFKQIARGFVMIPEELGLAFFGLLYRACGRVGGHSNLFFYKFQGVFCNQAAGHDMTLMTLNTFHLMINDIEYGTLPPKSSRTLCCFCKFTANSMAKFTANSMSTTKLTLETCRNNALKTVTIIHNDNGRTLEESKCPVKP